MNIRQANTEDFLAIASLDRQAWIDNNNSEYIPDGEHAWRLWVEHALVFCSTSDAKLITGAILAFPGVKGIYCVHKVFVEKKEQGKGIGFALFRELLSKIDTIGVACFLTVDPNNEKAIRLYGKWGFDSKQFVKGYYRDNEDRFVLTRVPSKSQTWISNFPREPPPSRPQITRGGQSITTAE